MEIEYDLKIYERKALVTALGEILNTKPTYSGAPTFDYHIGAFKIDRKYILTSIEWLFYFCQIV